MKVSELVDLLELEVFSGRDGLENTITGGYTSDLLSDVMGNVDEGHVWITLQTHKNVMAIASLKDVAAIIIVKGLLPGEETINQSNNEGIPLLGTSLETYEITGKLYQLLNK